MNSLTEKNHKNRQERNKQSAEVFTPDSLVNKMLNKLPKEVWRKTKTFCDPACGNGQFLIHVLYRKIQKSNKSYPLTPKLAATLLQTIYGVDIMQDNITETRLRLLKMIDLHGCPITKELIEITFKNIVWLNPFYYPQGSLDTNWHWNFNKSPKKESVETWLKNINEGKLLEVNLPIESPTPNINIFAEE